MVTTVMKRFFVLCLIDFMWRMLADFFLLHQILETTSYILRHTFFF